MHSNLFIVKSTLTVFGFNVTVNSLNLTTSQILNIPDSIVKTACNTNCTTATSTIQACNDDPICLCKADTVTALLSCEQCMFNKAIAINQQMDFRVGSQVLLTAYATSCKAVANITLAPEQTALELPATWDGPFGVVLPFGGVVITVIAGAFLGFSALLVLSNI